MTCKKLIVNLLFVLISHSLLAQGNLHQQSTQYEFPEDPLVRQKLDVWQDQKFGMIIHWGLYAVPGMIESWALCSEDWISRDSTQSYDDFKKWYWGLNKEFNPIKFDPDQWAIAAKSAGMKYVVFTTKHHDGFNMFDTKQSDFKISNGPFGTNPKADVARYVFEAFRKQDFMIGAYFSKPDWHSEYFWWNKYATPDRNVNYDIRKNPWRWNKFREFSYNQIQELVTGYGKLDILWLDGGWVRPLETVNDEVRAWGAAIPEFSQEIDMPAIATMARKSQPGLLIVDRTVHGKYENYQTPEQNIPAKKLDNPWESCITLGGAWGYVPNDQFKSSTKVIHSLVEIVAKGGSLLLGVGPTKEGLFLQEQIDRLVEIGDWMKVNGEAIYSTRATDFYRDGETFFTRSKDQKTTYAIIRLKENGPVPATVEWKGNLPADKTEVKLIGENAKLKWKKEGDKIIVTIPESFLKKHKTYPALAFRFQ
ncbi:alpha-L-fucosidase [Emticicia sp. CRIBPO]|uniref:alpha-L-fucosidase n=1 Tax=Emticicia sp. CRIBPO TaxID=2683258 RepID=UPI001412FF47|nr:alpha-L-fucosidase [Emticicia sp. CRIBPO]NBA87116.1 alpha-L-fucosidase [Emticicia sp. CRIBPO]